MPAPRAPEGAGVRPGVLLAVRPAEQQRAVAPREQVRVQLGPARPQVHRVPGSVVEPQDGRGLAGGGEGPGEREVVEAAWSDAGDGERLTLLLGYIL